MCVTCVYAPPFTSRGNIAMAVKWVGWSILPQLSSVVHETEKINWIQKKHVLLQTSLVVIWTKLFISVC